MYCTNCGKENKEGASFCTDCGKQFDRVTFAEISVQKTASDIPAPPEPFLPPTSIIPEMPTMPDMPSPLIIAPPPQIGELHTPPASPQDLQPQPPPNTQGAYNAPSPIYTQGQYHPPPNIKKSNNAIIIAIIIATIAFIGLGIAVSLFVYHLVG